MDSRDEILTEEGNSITHLDQIPMEDIGGKNLEEEHADSNVEQSSKEPDTSEHISVDDTSEEAAHTNAGRQDSLAENNELQPEGVEDSTNIDAHYHNLSLGLVMTLAFRLSGDVKTAAITAILLTIFVNISA